MTPTQQAFIRKQKQLIAKAQKLDTQAIKDMYRLLREMRAEITSRAAAVTGLSEYPNLKKDIAAQIEYFERQYTNIIHDYSGKAYQAGGEIIEAPLAATDTGKRLLNRLAVVDNSTLLVMNEYSADLVSNVSRDLLNKINNQILLGLQGGLPTNQIIQNIGTNIDKGVFKTSSLRAEFITRTEINRVLSTSQEIRTREIANIEPQTKKYWLTANNNRVRASHVVVGMATDPANGGTPINVNDDYSVGGFSCGYPHDPRLPAKESINCFVGENFVFTDSEIKNSFKHYYSGELITIKSSSGVEFSATPYHPIMTSKGWVSIKSLNKGDDIIIGTIRDNFISRIYPYIDNVKTSFSNVHNSFKRVSFVKRIGSAYVNFHGDVPDSDIEIVFIKRFLHNRVKSFILNFKKKIFFKFTNFMKRFFIRYRFIYKFSLGYWKFSSRLVSFCNKFFSVLWFGSLHSFKHGFRLTSYANFVLSKKSINNSPGDIVDISKLLYGYTGQIEIDNVVDIKVSNYFGHVYNLHTENNIYLVNNIPHTENKSNYKGVIAHNCRCNNLLIIQDEQE